MNLEQKKFWIKQSFTNGVEYTELRGDECRNAPQSQQVSDVMNSLIGNRINIVEFDLMGKVEKDKVLKVGHWYWDMFEVDELMNIFTDNVSIVLGVEISPGHDTWRTNVQFKNGKVYDITAMNMMDDTELTIYRDKPVKIFEIRPEKRGRSVISRYSYKF